MAIIIDVKSFVGDEHKGTKSLLGDATAWNEQQERFGRTYWGERAVSLKLAPGERVYGLLEPAEIRGERSQQLGISYSRDSKVDDNRIDGPLHVQLLMDEAQAEALMMGIWFQLKWVRGEWNEEWDTLSEEEQRALRKTYKIE